MFKNKEIRIKSSLTELYKVEAFVETISDVFNVNSNYYSTILISLDEAVRNSIEHGNKFDEKKNVIIAFKTVQGALVFSVIDEGEGFNSKQFNDPTNLESELEMDLGKGLFLMKQLSDDLIFNKRGNEVSLHFKISGINRELAIQRSSALNSFFQENKITVKN